MRRIYYNKLIRDNIPERIRAAGDECEVREITDNDEYQQELLKKVSEEAQGLSHVRTREDFLNEYTDLLAVLNALIDHMGFAHEDIERAKEDNMKKKGGFGKRYFLHWSSDSGYTSNETPQGTSS